MNGAPGAARRILVTGPTGGLGSEIVRLGAHPLTTRLESPVTDMAAEIAAAPGHALIHCAALTGVTECESDPARARRLNVEGALKWLEAAAPNGCGHFLFVSTAHVFAPSDRPLTADSPVGPRSVYARTKLEAEEALHDRARRLGAIKMTVARVFSILHALDRPGSLLTGLRDRARRRDFSPVPGLGNQRDFLTAAEVAARFLDWARLPPERVPATILICSGRAIPVRDLLLKVFAEQGLDGSPIAAAPGRADDVPLMVGVPTPLPRGD